MTTVRPPKRNLKTTSPRQNGAANGRDIAGKRGILARCAVIASGGQKSNSRTHEFGSYVWCSGPGKKALVRA